MNGNKVSIGHAIRGPVTLITVGVLFALNNFTEYSFRMTWPVILIVFGLLSLLRRSEQNRQSAEYPYGQTGPYPQGGYAGYQAPPYAQGGYPQPAPPAPGSDASGGAESQPPAPGGSI